MRAVIIAQPTDDATTSSGKAVPIGCMDVATTHGVIHFHDGPGFMTTRLERVNVKPVIALFVYETDEMTGLCTQLTPEHAREIAVSLLRLANEIDPASKH